MARDVPPPTEETNRGVRGCDEEAHRFDVYRVSVDLLRRTAVGVLGRGICFCSCGAGAVGCLVIVDSGTGFAGR
ncbi:hypothetical protein N7454_000021 [Penicillium verhagenii]|nr:hypothetical protein N7454_000021 [Penicillium verhagenii]